MIKLIKGDFFEQVKAIPDNSIDMIWADIPYGTTDNKWDELWDMEQMWVELNRIARDNRVPMVFTSSEPFNVDLINTNRKMFKYSWVWEKNQGSNFGSAKYRPLKKHELVLVFYKEYGVYNPQKIEIEPVQEYRGGSRVKERGGCYGKGLYDTPRSRKESLTTSRYPGSVQKFITVNNATGRFENRVRHPTEKPVDLIEYMIKTYTSPGDRVFDPCHGTGSSALAAHNTGREYIGIELNHKYHRTAQLRLARKQREGKDE